MHRSGRTEGLPEGLHVFGEVQAQRPVFYFPAGRNGRQDGTVP